MVLSVGVTDLYEYVMACRGSYSALLPQEAATLLEMVDVEQRLEFLESLFQTALADGRILLVDKSWDAMHRVLCDGWLDFKHGDEPRRACVIGGRQLSNRSDWIISYVEPNLVKQVAASIDGVSREWFTWQYFALDRMPSGFWVHRYDAELCDVDFEYTWEYFVEVQGFYRMAAGRGLATVFAVDQ